MNFYYYELKGRQKPACFVKEVKMKSLIIGILVLGSISAFSSMESQSLEKRLTCIRKIVETKKINAVYLPKVYNLVKNISQLDDSYFQQNCNLILKEIKDDHQTHKMSKKQMFDFIEETYPGEMDSTALILKRFSWPTIRCSKLYGGQVDVGVVFGLGVGVAAGKCLSENGKKYILVSPTVSSKAAIGFAAIFGKYEEIEFKSGEFIHKHNSVEYGVGIVKEDEYQQHDGRRFGIGFYGGVGDEFNFKLLAVKSGNNFNEIFKLLDN